MKKFNFIVGKINSGKTTFAKTIRARGVLTISYDNKKSLYVKNLDTNEEDLLMYRDKEGLFKIMNETFDKTNEYLKTLKSGIVLVDEVGKIELNKGGFYTSLEHLIKQEVVLYITIRDTNLSDFISLFNVKDYNIINV